MSCHKLLMIRRIAWKAWHSKNPWKTLWRVVSWKRGNSQASTRKHLTSKRRSKTLIRRVRISWSMVPRKCLTRMRRMKSIFPSKEANLPITVGTKAETNSRSLLNVTLSAEMAHSESNHQAWKSRILTQILLKRMKERCLRILLPMQTLKLWTKASTTITTPSNWAEKTPMARAWGKVELLARLASWITWRLAVDSQRTIIKLISRGFRCLRSVLSRILLAHSRASMKLVSIRRKALPLKCEEAISDLTLPIISLRRVTHLALQSERCDYLMMRTFNFKTTSTILCKIYAIASI